MELKADSFLSFSALLSLRITAVAGIVPTLQLVQQPLSLFLSERRAVSVDGWWRVSGRRRSRLVSRLHPAR